MIGGASACGDGRYVVFTTIPGNNVWRVDPKSGGVRKLTTGAFDLNPACSRDGPQDGKWLSRASGSTRSDVVTISRK